MKGKCKPTCMVVWSVFATSYRQYLKCFARKPNQKSFSPSPLLLPPPFPLLYPLHSTNTLFHAQNSFGAQICNVIYKNILSTMPIDILIRQVVSREECVRVNDVCV